eukprot:TRINITY_DN4356_c0_g1_i1.p1 TRINITY_DN4356_c0_g1~~TRINITY_DN4356_c0_g1_i1.p1  ORF type:complete len:695 (-),score=146.47 TRINITY_DN4356_c0_g1_i1:128-2212(-)
MRFQYQYFYSRIFGPLHDMLQANSIELKRIAVPFAVSFEKRINQLRYGEESAIVCDIWLLDVNNKVYRATMRNDSRFLFLPLTSSDQDVRLVSLFTSPTGDILGIDDSGELREATAMHNAVPQPSNSNSDATLVSRSLGLKPIVKPSPNPLLDNVLANQQASSQQPVPFVEAGFVGKTLVGIDQYGHIWHRYQRCSEESLANSSCLPHMEFEWVKTVQAANIKLASISDRWGLSVDGKLMKATDERGEVWKVIEEAVSGRTFTRVSSRDASSCWLIEDKTNRLILYDETTHKIKVTPKQHFTDIYVGQHGHLWTLKRKQDDENELSQAFCPTPTASRKTSSTPSPNLLSTSTTSTSMNRSASTEAISSSITSPIPPARFKFNEIAKLIIQEIETLPIRRFVKIWDDRNTGAKENDIAIFRPVPPSTPSAFVVLRRGNRQSLWRRGRWISLGDYAERSHLDHPLSYNFENSTQARSFFVRESVMLSETEFKPDAFPLRGNKGLKEVEERDVSTEFVIEDDDDKLEKIGQDDQEELETFDIEFDERVHSSALRDILPPPLLAFPDDFELVWTDVGTGGIAKKYGEVSIWRPLPPKGYVVLGHLSSPDRNSKPSTTCMACIRRNAVIPTTLYKYPGESTVNTMGFLWTDRFSGGKSDCSFWVADGEDGVSVASTTFISTKGYRPPQGSCFWSFPIVD